MDPLQVISTGDGSHSLLNTALRETYHSVHGAIQESKYVFLEQGLIEFQRRNPDKLVRLLEIGFGTGLNALLSLQDAKQQGLTLYYESWENFPLPDEIVRQLNYGETLGDPNTFEEIHRAHWNEMVTFHPAVTLFKKLADVLTDAIERKFDVIYYDAFAPSKQPELWTIDVLRKVTDALDRGGIWVTYCAKGQVKRDLATLGLIVEPLPGPPGKKEMTRACRPK